MFVHFIFELNICIALLSVIWNRKTHRFVRWYMCPARKCSYSVTCGTEYIMQNMPGVLCPPSNFPLAISKPPFALFRDNFWAISFFYLTIAKFMHRKLVIQEKSYEPCLQQQEQLVQTNTRNALDKSTDKHLQGKQHALKSFVKITFGQKILFRRDLYENVCKCARACRIGRFSAVIKCLLHKMHIKLITIYLHPWLQYGFALDTPQ